MSNEDFRRELNRAIDDITGSPSPALSHRVRSAVGDRGRERSGGPFWIAGVAAAVIALVFISVLVIGNPLGHRQSQAGVATHASPTPATRPSANQSPSPAVSASPSSPGFACSVNPIDFSKPGAPLTAFVDAMRTGSHAGYDRLTVEFSNGQPATVQVTSQNGTSFTKSPSGQPTTVKGANGILVKITGADIHTDYSGSRDILTGYRGLAEIVVIEDFEGTVQLALGLNGPACYSATWLDNPGRLVIDVQAP